MLDALARAMHLDDDEHQHLRELAARAARYAPEPPPPPSRTVRPHLKLVLETMRPNPAYIISRSMDLLAWNPGGLALYAGLADWPATQRNLARYLFLHPTARTLFPDWDAQVRGCVARLRTQAGIDPDAPDLTSLVGELLLKSPDFAKLWERYDVIGRKRIQKTFHHPQVGILTLSAQSMHLDGTPGQRLGVYTAEPGTPDHDAMLLLDLTAPSPSVTRTPRPNSNNARSPDPRQPRHSAFRRDQGSGAMGVSAEAICSRSARSSPTSATPRWRPAPRV